MSLLTPSAAKGQPFFEGSSSLRQHDNASDNMAGGAYSHNPLEGSATEADEWASIMLYLFQVAKSGGGAFGVRNTSGGTLNAGPVRVTGYDVANAAFLIGAADAAGNTFAHALLLANLANNTNGTAYIGGTFTSGIDTSGSAVGNPVYLAAGGGLTLTAPSGADQIQQIAGRVQTLANPGVISGFITAPMKLGTSWLQTNAVTNAKIGSGAAASGQLLTADGAGNSSWANPVVSGAAGGDLSGTYPNPTVISVADVTAGVLKIANGGTNSSTALTNNQLVSSSGGKMGELGAMTDGQIVVGKSANAPQIVSASGDISAISNAGAFTVNKANAYPWTGNHSFAAQFVLKGVNSVTPSTSQNDWNPTNLAASNVLRITTTAATSITGIAAQPEGAILILENAAGGFVITLKNQNTGSSAANRFKFGFDLTLAPNESCTIGYDGTNSVWRLIGRGTIPHHYILVEDQKSQGTNGGGFSNGAFRTRDLNSLVADTGGYASVASNQITLQPGTYECYARCPAYAVDRHQAQLQNITDSATLLTGSSEFASSSGAESTSHVIGRFTITAQKVLELQHRCQTSNATNGFGLEANFNTEKFSQIQLIKVG